MKIQEISINKFKNFKNLKIEFDNNNYDVIIGENGAGKSNFFEAIIEIFLFLLENAEENIFEFKIKYILTEKEIEVEYKEGKISYKLNGEKKEISDKKKFPTELLPETLMLYYSGQNERINSYILKYEEKYRGKNRKSIVKQKKELRNIFGILKEHKSILLLLLFIYKENENFKRILDEIKIEGEFLKGKLVLKTPFYLKKKKQESMSIYDENRFWGIKGEIDEKLLELVKGNKGNPLDGNEGFFTKTQEFYITLDKDTLQYFSQKYSIYETFSFFDDLRIIEMLEGLELKIKKDGEEFSDNNLSE